MPWYGTSTDGGMQSDNESSFSTARGTALTVANAAYPTSTQLNSQGFLINPRLKLQILFHLIPDGII